MWKLKVLIQFVLSHIPYGEQLNHVLQRLQAKRKGGSRRVTERRLPGVCAALKMLQRHTRLEDAVVVEVGTGWCPVPTILLYLCGARRVYTYDHVRHLRLDLVRELISVLEDQQDKIADEMGVSREGVASRLAKLKGSTSLDDLCRVARIEYVAPGDAADTKLPDWSVDVFFSYAVLEHVPELVVRRLAEESRRVLRPDGCFYAHIDLGDHYAAFHKSLSQVNFLKYPEWLWALFVKNNISYHNRMREREFLDILGEYGARMRQVQSRLIPDDVERVRGMKINSRFSQFTPEECAVTLTDIVASFDAVPAGVLSE